MISRRSFPASSGGPSFEPPLRRAPLVRLFLFHLLSRAHPPQAENCARNVLRPRSPWAEGWTLPVPSNTPRKRQTSSGHSHIKSWLVEGTKERKRASIAERSAG